MVKKLLFVKKFPFYVEVRKKCLQCGCEILGYAVPGCESEIEDYCDECCSPVINGEISDMIILENDLVGLVDEKED